MNTHEIKSKFNEIYHQLEDAINKAEKDVLEQQSDALQANSVEDMYEVACSLKKIASAKAALRALGEAAY